MAGQVDDRRFFAKALRVAAALEEPRIAGMLVEPFGLRQLSVIHATPLRSPVEGYGAPWVESRVRTWASRGDWLGRGDDRAARWFTTWPALCAALGDSGGPGSVAASLVLAEVWRWLRDRLATAAGDPAPSRRRQALVNLAAPVAALVESTSLVDPAGMRREVLGVLQGDGEDIVVCGVAVLRAEPPARWAEIGLDGLALHCAASLSADLERPPRAPGDWSVSLPPGGCGCELCVVLRGLLTDASRRILEWPLAEDRRRHVQARIGLAELPVTHQTRRKGRPCTLILAKTDELFSREEDARRQAASDLASIEGIQEKPRQAGAHK